MHEKELCNAWYGSAARVRNLCSARKTHKPRAWVVQINNVPSRSGSMLKCSIQSVFKYRASHALRLLMIKLPGRLSPSTLGQKAKHDTLEI